MSRFQAIRSERAARLSGEAPKADAAAPSLAGRTAARVGKKAISGYFSGDLRRELHLLGLEQGKRLQALMGEAFDDLLRKYGKHPFGER